MKGVNLMESEKFTLNKTDLGRIGKNAFVFMAPAILLLLADLVKALPDWLDGPYLIIAMWLVNITTDGVRKFVSGK